MKILIIDGDGRNANYLKSVVQSIDPKAIVLDVLGSEEECFSWFEETFIVPDLVLLDLKISKSEELNLWNALKVKYPLIFTVPDQPELIRTLKSNRITYVKKPVKKNDLSKAIQAYRRILKKEDRKWPLFKAEPLLTRPYDVFKTRFIGKSGRILKSIPVEEVAYFFVDDQHICLSTFEEGIFRIDYSITKLKSMVNPEMFFRLNNQILSSRDAIDRFTLLKDGQFRVELIPSFRTKIMISKRNAQAFGKWVGRQDPASGLGQ